MLTALKHDTYYLNYILARICVRALPLADVWSRAVQANLNTAKSWPYICIVGQNHIYTVHIRYFWQENHQIYGHIRCVCTVLANPIHMVMANTQGQYIHMVMVNTQGQFIHGYGQYPRSIHSWLWPTPKVNTFIWLWPLPKVNTFIWLWPIYGHYIHMVMANT